MTFSSRSANPNPCRRCSGGTRQVGRSTRNQLHRSSLAIRFVGNRRICMGPCSGQSVQKYSGKMTPSTPATTPCRQTNQPCTGTLGSRLIRRKRQVSDVVPFQSSRQVQRRACGQGLQNFFEVRWNQFGDLRRTAATPEFHRTAQVPQACQSSSTAGLFVCPRRLLRKGTSGSGAEATGQAVTSPG